MPLSYSKLERLLSSRGFVTKKIYTINGKCVYLEILCISNADSFLLYIPSKYDLVPQNNTDIFEIIYLDIEEDGTIPNDYAGEPDNFDLGKAYDQVDIQENNDENENLEDKLKENYNHPISLKNMSKEDNTELRDVMRQLKRLKFCTQGIKYKVSIAFKNFLCSIKRDDILECYLIRNIPYFSDRKLMVTIDLESFYSKIDSLSIDIITVKEGIYDVLNKNQINHTKNLQHMLQQRNDIMKHSDVIYKRKDKYSKYLKSLQEMLKQLGESERKIIEKIYIIQEKYDKSNTTKSLHTDATNSHQIGKLESELDKLNNVKQEIITNISEIKGKLESLSLMTDCIFFDNRIMLDAILKNFKLLDKLS